MCTRLDSKMAVPRDVLRGLGHALKTILRILYANMRTENTCRTRYSISISILNFIGSTSIICSGAMCMHVDYSIFVALTGS